MILIRYKIRENLEFVVGSDELEDNKVNLYLFNTDGIARKCPVAFGPMELSIALVALLIRLEINVSSLLLDDLK